MLSPRLENVVGERLVALKLFLQHYYTWWHGATLNTLFYTWRAGELVGHDEFGNAYYRTKGRKIDPALGFERRWVIYNGISEASMTPPGWNGWLHHTVDVAPTEENYQPHPWELPHIGNPTGTPEAIRPKGSILRSGPRQANSGDYEAWSPDR
jgi:NADH:ubiquinone oxidoreductase subunit